MFYKDSNTLSSFPNALTQFYFLFGTNICHSRSPGLHSTWFQQHTINALYLPAPLTEPTDFPLVLKNLMLIQSFAGGNMTMPFKHAVTKILGLEHDDIVQKTRSANTLYQNQKGSFCWRLANTDVHGIEKTFEYLLDGEQDYDIVLLGGGGAASSAVYVGSQDPLCKRIFCFTRNPQKTADLFFPTATPKKLTLDFLNCHTTILDRVHASGPLLLINSIPPLHATRDLIAMQLFDAWLSLKKDILYFDMSYTRTAALDKATALEIKHADGELMFLSQAQKSFFHWTKIMPSSTSAV